MKVLVAGKDRSDDLGRELVESARKRLEQPGPRFLSPQHSALALREAESSAEYLDIFLNLMRIRTGLDTRPFAIPTRRGLPGKISVFIKRLLWRILRYQHDRVAFQQNVINELLASAVALESDLRKREVALLEERVAELEGRLKHGGGTSKRGRQS